MKNERRSGARRRGLVVDVAVVACVAALIASLMLGGGTHAGFLADVVLQLLSIPLLMFAIWRAGQKDFAEPLWPVFAFWSVLVLVHVAQLIPLPPDVWSTLGPRADLAAGLTSIGRRISWSQLSVAPDATLTALMSLIPPLAVFLLTMQLAYPQRRKVTLVLLGFGVVSVFFGLLQLSQGQSSPMRLYSITNPSDSVGFFANRNHFAALLYVLLLFASVCAWQAMVSMSPKPGQRGLETPSVLWVCAGLVLVVLLIAGQIMARSRAGLGLTILALLGTIAVAVADRRTVARISPARFVLGLTLVTVVGSAQYGLYQVVARFADDPLRDARIPFGRQAIEAATAFMPFGAGVGSFVPIYEWFEKPKDAILDIYANRAHNDFLEWWLETGAVGLVLMAAFVVWLAVKTLAVWRWQRPGGEPFDRGLARAASLSLMLLIAHSVVDYPLRTNAMMAIAAFCCGMLMRPPIGDGASVAEIRAFTATMAAADAKQRGRPHLPYLPDTDGASVAAAGENPATAVPGWAEVSGGEGAAAARTPAWGVGVEWPDSWRTVSPATRKAGTGTSTDESGTGGT